MPFLSRRRHNGSKLKSLYKALKLHKGKTSKFQTKKIDVESVTDVKQLHVLLFNAERAWAFAMQLKKDVEKSPNLRRHYHLVRRLAKALSWSRELCTLSSSCCDLRSQVEAQAYSSLISGHLLLEKGSEWAMSLAMFTRSKMILHGLVKSSPQAQQQSLLVELIEEIEPHIRFCQYQMSRQKQEVPSEASLLAATDGTGHVSGAQLKTMIDQLSDSSQTLATSSIAPSSVDKLFFSWQGRDFGVVVDRAMTPLVTADEIRLQISSAVSRKDNGDSILSLYSKLIGCYGEARSQVRNALRTLTASSKSLDTGSMRDEMTVLESALQGSVLEVSVEKAKLLTELAFSRFSAGMDRLAKGKKAGKEKDKFAKAEDVVKIIDASLIRSLRDLSELGSSGQHLGGRAGEALTDRCMAQLAATQAARTYFVAHGMLAGGRPVEAFALFGRCLDGIREARALFSELPPPPPPPFSSPTHSSDNMTKPGSKADDLVGLDRFSDLAASYRAVARAESCLVVLKGQEALEQGITNVSLSDESPSLNETPRYLIDKLESWESYAGHPASAKGPSSPPRVTQVPYAMQPLAMRPIMLDTASSYVEYPDISRRFKKSGEKGGGAAAGGGSMLSSLFGWGKK